jgi:ABC-type transporter Mla subunit MlaD
MRYLKFIVRFLFRTRHDLHEIKHQLRRIMATAEETLAALAAANASLDGIAQDIATLTAAIGANAGNVPQDVADAAAALAAKAAAIDAQNPPA